MISKMIVCVIVYILTAMTVNAQNVTDTADSTALDSIDMHQLHEVVVKGQLSNTRLKGNALVTRITGSPLEKSGTAEDVLGKVPGMMKKGTDLEVIGRGKPLYYINGRKLRDMDELKRIMSDEVAQVEVIMNPGAMYDASVGSVVRIRLVKKQGDGFGFSTFAKTEQSLQRGLNDPEAQINVNYRKNGLDIFASAKEWQYRTGNWSDLGQQTTHPVTGEGMFDYIGTMNHFWKGIGTHVGTGFNWQINNNHSLGAKIDYSVQTTSKTVQDTWMEQRDRGVLTETLNSDTEQWSDNPDNVSINAYYNGNAGKLNIDFNTDVFISNKKDHEITYEMATQGNRMVESASASKNKMIAAKLVLSYPIWKGMLNVGSEGTFVKRDDSNENCGAELPNSLSKVKDNTYAGFVDYGLALSRNIQANVGLRYEHVSFDFQDLLNPSHSMERHYNDWFPSAGINAQIGKVRLMLSFSSRTNRPSFWQLNNSVTYHNRYTMQRGNATLKPSKEKSFSLISMVGMFTAGVHYSYVTDQICFWGQQINEEGGIMISHKNLDKPQHSMNLFLTASKTWGCYTPSWTTAFVKQWLTLDFDNGSKSFNKPMWVFNANNAFRWKKEWQAELNWHYHTKANYSNIELTRYQLGVEAAIQKSLLKDNALTLRLAVQDIFQKNNDHVFIYYGSYTVAQNNKYDFNRVVLTVRYNFNTARSKYKGTGAGQDARSRFGGDKK